MGTKHGYTEKRCNVCGKMKKRAEFPKRGGLACTTCQNLAAKKYDAERRERLKDDPKHKEYHRNKSREWRRKKKEE